MVRQWCYSPATLPLLLLNDCCTDALLGRTGRSPGSLCNAGGRRRSVTGVLLRWRSNRILCDDELQWVDPAENAMGAPSAVQYMNAKEVS